MADPNLLLQINSQPGVSSQTAGAPTEPVAPSELKKRKAVRDLIESLKKQGAPEAFDPTRPEQEKPAKPRPRQDQEVEL
jgi:hypothetical protein